MILNGSIFAPKKKKKKKKTKEHEALFLLVLVQQVDLNNERANCMAYMPRKTRGLENKLGWILSRVMNGLT